MDGDTKWLADELEALRGEYANLRDLIRAYIRGEISRSGLTLEFAILQCKHDIRVAHRD
jgi:hypothetical protein